MLPELALLIGVWIQPCEQSLVKEEHFSAEKVALVETNFVDAACTKPLLESRSEGEYSLGEELPLAPRGHAMDFQFTKVEIRGRSAEVVQWLQQQKFCGIADWQLDQFVEVSGKICEFPLGKIQVPEVGDRRFGIFRVEDNLLYFGKLTPIRDGKSRESRPTEWDPKPYRRLNLQASEASYQD